MSSTFAYDGSAIMITGNDQGEWVSSAQVSDHVGPLLTVVVRNMFDGAAKRI